MDSVVITKPGTTLLKMLDPVETCILNLRRKTLLHLTVLDISHKCTGSVQVTDILLERVRHKPYAVDG